MPIFDSFLSPFRARKAAPAAEPTVVVDNPNEPPEQTILKTLIIVYEPTMDPTSGVKLSQYMHWNNVEDLAKGYMSDVLQVSNGLVRHQIVERIDVDGFPSKVDGFLYDPRTYLAVLRGMQPYMPQEANYYDIIDRFQILQRVAQNEIDEVWIFNFPHAGFYESIMAGPGAFWCNAPPLNNNTEASGRRFVIMGFSYERGVGEMLENLGHRAESILEKTFEGLEGQANLWKRFSRYDKSSAGNAAVGTIHFAPNSERDYDWNNQRPVASECDDWLNNFPNLQGIKRLVTANDWGNGDTRQHHLWWLKHLPKTAGRTHGIHNNWWQYVMNPNNVHV